MSEPQSAGDASPRDEQRHAGRVPYPTNHVVAVIDDATQVAGAVDDLTRGGFLKSEIEVVSGQQAADDLAASSGHTGLTDLIMRVAEKLHMTDEELETKKEYERALRDGSYVVTVLASSEERKKRAADLLGGHGARSVKFLGRFSIQTLAD